LPSTTSSSKSRAWRALMETFTTCSSPSGSVEAERPCFVIGDQGVGPVVAAHGAGRHAAGVLRLGLSLVRLVAAGLEVEPATESADVEPHAARPSRKAMSVLMPLSIR